MQSVAQTGRMNWRLIGWGTLAVLMSVPLIAMQFTREVAWDPGDFLVMAILLTAVGFGVEAAIRLLSTTRSRALACAVVALAFLLVWAELAVGLFD